MQKHHKITTILTLLLCLSFANGCKEAPKKQNNKTIEQNQEQQSQATSRADSKEDTQEIQPTAEAKQDYINESGICLKERITVPDGFTRIQYKKNSFGAFLENYPLCEDGQPVLLYNGNEKTNQNAHVAVFDMDMTDGDLQQCADSVIRMYAEYFYKQNQYEKMKFQFVNGFSCDFDKWSKGMRVSVNGNDTSWYQGTNADASKETLESYLRTVFSYASTLSLEQESKGIEPEGIESGDIFICGGSPGHVVMVVDVCENEKGEKAFLLAQGYMPAQQFHILKNPQHEENPWYYETELSYPLRTPEYTFGEGSLMRPKYNQ